MPRTAREKSESGIYHIIIRGINRQNIFEYQEDYERFIETMKRYKKKSGYEIYAYCLMGNHVHLLLKEVVEPLEQVMRRICGSYVYWYNNKYERVGNLFQDRFKSEPVDNDGYFLIVLRYIHQNPIKAGMVERAEQYNWSSYKEYVGSDQVVDTAFCLERLSDDRERAKKSFIEYHQEENNNQCLDIEITQKNKIQDKEAQSIIKKVCKVRNAIDVQNFDVETRNVYLRELKIKYRLSIRQIERLTGINRGIIQRI